MSTVKGRGRFPGRGRQQINRFRPSKKIEGTTRKELSDFNYYLGTARQASEYEETTEYLINHIKKTFEYGSDIATALKEMCPPKTNTWRPSMRTSIASDEALKKVEIEQFKIEFRSDYESYRKRLQVYENNRTKAYALLWERSTKAIKNRIEARSDFAVRIENDPIELLKAIKDHSLNYQENRYSMSIVLDSMRNLMSTKQKDGETLQDYTKRFRVAREVFESQWGGPMVLTKLVKTMDEYSNNLDDLEKAQLEMKTFEQFLAYLYLENADQAKYGSILAGLNTQQSLGNNQYPTTITEANNVLSIHKFDAAIKEQVSRHQKISNNVEPINLTFTQIKGKCYCCGKPGHRSPQCRFKSKPKIEWAINAVPQSNAQIGASNVASNTSAQETNTANASEQEHTTGCAGIDVQLYEQAEMKNWILLDNQSTVSIFCNKDLVTDIRPTNDDHLNLVTNAYELLTRLRCRDGEKFGSIPQPSQIFLATRKCPIVIE